MLGHIKCYIIWETQKLELYPTESIVTCSEQFQELPFWLAFPIFCIKKNAKHPSETFTCILTKFVTHDLL